MIDKPLSQVTYADIDRLLQEKWSEGKTIEYKSTIYGGRDEDKKELLKDVSAFANTQGGDILIGIEASQAIPVSIPGVAVADIDKETLRMEEIVRRGLDPRFEIAVHSIPTPKSTTVLIVRVQESVLFPHRVVYQGKPGDFWARSTAGNFSMDTGQLRQAFNLSATIYEQIKAFRSERVTQVSNGNTPVTMATTWQRPVSQAQLLGRRLEGATQTIAGLLVLHLVPVTSFRSIQLFNVAGLPQLAVQFPPMASSSYDHRLNFDGHVSFNRVNDKSTAYTQFFRNGVTESVIAGIVIEDHVNGKHLDAERCERMLMGHIPQVIKGFRELDIRPPIWALLTIIGTKGALIHSEAYFSSPSQGIDRDVLRLPEAVIDDLEVDVSIPLRPIFDLVWNAGGLPRSPRFDDKGKWRN